MKRIVSILLLLCLLAALPLQALADPGGDTLLDYVRISSAGFPRDNCYPDYSATVPEDYGYRVATQVEGGGWARGVQWLALGGQTLHPQDRFVLGDSYLLRVALQPQEGYAWAEDVYVEELMGSEGTSFFFSSDAHSPAEGCLIAEFLFTAGPATARVDISVLGPANAGSVSGGGSYPVGTRVTVSAQPNLGYAFYGWSGYGDRFITAEHSYSFTLTEDTVLYADFTQAPFGDIRSSDYFYDPVVWAVDLGVTTGTGGGRFSPDAGCTRAQAVTFLWRAAGCPASNTTGRLYEDTEADAWYSEAVAWATEKGITTGTGATTFSPDAVCTRAQIVTFLWRYFDRQTVSTASNFVDVKPTDYFYEAVRFALHYDITKGTSDTTFSPNAVCTRAQIVTFLYRSMPPVG